MAIWIGPAERVEVEAPLMKAMVGIVSPLMGRAYAAEAPRALENPGLDDYDIEELKKL